MTVVLGEASLKYVERPGPWNAGYYISIHTMEKVKKKNLSSNAMRHHQNYIQYH